MDQNANHASTDPGTQEVAPQLTSSMSSRAASHEPANVNTMPAFPPDNMEVLVSLMEGNLLDLEATIDKGQAPTPIFIGLQPPPQYEDACRDFNTLMGMSTMARLFAAINQINARKNQGRSAGFRIGKPDEILAAFAEGADAIVHALTRGPLTSCYAPGAGLTQDLQPSLKRSELHGFLLKRILGDLSQVNDEIMEKVDQVLTNFTNLMKSRKMNATTDQPTLNQSVIINYIKATDITGNGAAFVVECYTRLVFIKLKPEDWTHALQKPGFLKRNEKITFPFQLTINDLKLDLKAYNAAKPKWEQVLNIVGSDSTTIQPILSKGGIEEYGKETSIMYPMNWHVQEP